MILIAWEVTAACNLACRYCRASASVVPAEGELSTEEAYAFIDQVAPLRPMLILSGGEPLQRGDIFELAQHATEQGIRVSLATNGTRLTPELVDRIVVSGISRVSVSLDGASAQVNDASRGQGSFEMARSGIALLRDRIDFQINMTLTRSNKDEIGDLLDMAEAEGAVAVHFFFMVPTGRGQAEDQLSSVEQQALLEEIMRQSGQRDIDVQTTCAPQYARILLESGAQTGQAARRRSGGCLAARSFVFVSRTGEVYPCGYLQVSAGNIRNESFSRIWDTSPLLLDLRQKDLKGRCGLCRYRTACGGCRARAYSHSGDWLSEDPSCTLPLDGPSALSRKNAPDP
ncbi:MAG: pyrroloquinoline quinone biosynthesis protein PqqE [Methanosaeta sp. PtaB.Bin039]|nr:MAG: pyrroloquinoline quinone biosynthesis protein PqqE [Methanosaeta sp. PtaB.Bin039]HOT07248.1 radical SAM protein [Methanotrichaceae archaeon]HQF17276.1 radical SAM protein [Methanotrichaceae archaeon]HQI91849.1 radical SAM protein [Methanotrichaceae archaeon]HQJ29179.1 radical SAM protein [Methanotrichaceae archaeon]